MAVKKRKFYYKLLASTETFGFPVVFWGGFMSFKVFYIPHDVDKIKARKSIQDMLDRVSNKVSKFKINKSKL